MIIFSLTPIIISLLFSLHVSISSSAVVGIDFGNDLFKVGIAALGRPFEIVLNLHSHRKTPSAVSFVETTREFGEPALVQANKQSSDVLVVVPTLFAVNISSTKLDSIPNKFLPIDIVPDNERGTIGIHLKKRNVTLAPEEIAANLLQFVGRTVANFQGSTERIAKLDAVITIPSSYNMRQRQSVVDAATISGVTVLGLIRETPAAALHHARDLPANYTGTKMFINVGAWHTEACVVSYNLTSTSTKRPKSVTTVVGCDETNAIGGRHVDILLADVISKKVEEKFNVKELPPRALQRILAQTQKTKLVLSANKKSDFFVEGLHQDKDFHTAVTRDELEKLVEPSLPAMKILIDNVLKQTGVTLDKLNGIEVIGAGWRMPRIQQEIGNIIKPHDLGQHVNGDEGSALGATLMAANSSSTFKIKGILFSDPSEYQYTLRMKNVTEGNVEWTTKDVIKMGGLFGEVVTINTPGCYDLMAELIETDKYGKSTLLTKYSVSGIKEACDGKFKELGSPKVTLSFTTSAAGIVTLDNVFAQWIEKYMAPAPKPVATTTAAPADKASGVNDTNSESTTTTTTTTAPKETTTTTTEAPQMIEQTRKRTVKCQVNATETLPRPMTSEEISKAKKVLTGFETVDANAVKLAKTRNNLESFIYATRADLLKEEFIEVSEEAERSKIGVKLTEAEDWLYEDGATAALDAVQKKLRDLEADVNPVSLRILEKKGRVEIADLTRMIHSKIKAILDPESVQAIELNATKVEAFGETWKSFESWYDEKKAEQAKKKLTETPAYSVSEVHEKLTKVTQEFETLRRTGKIKPQQIKLTKNGTETANVTVSFGTPDDPPTFEIPTASPPPPVKEPKEEL